MFAYGFHTIVYFGDINLYTVVIFYTHCTIPQIYIDLQSFSPLLTDSIFYNSSLCIMIVVQLELYILVDPSLRFLLHNYKAYKNSVDRKFKQHA